MADAHETLSPSRIALGLALTALLATACDNKSSGGVTTPEPSTSATTAAVASSSASAAASASAAPATSASSAANARPARRFGTSGMLFGAARDMDLKPEQDAKLEVLDKPLQDEDPAWKEEMKGLHADLLAGIKAGKIDAAKTQVHYTAIDNAAKARRDKEVVALDGLYALLDATQRKALVASVRAKQGEHETKMMAARDAGAGDAGAPDWSKKRVERMTKELDLDDAQQKAVLPLLAKQGPNPGQMQTFMADAKKRMDALLTAFDGATFDAKKLDLGESPKKAHEMMDRHVQFFTALLPILKPEQREKLAAKMEREHQGGDGDGPHGRGRGMHGGDHAGYPGFPFEEEKND